VKYSLKSQIIPIVSCFVLFISLNSCQKETVILQKSDLRLKKDIPSALAPAAVTGYTLYTINKGANFCDKSSLKSVKTSEMKFYARFDASAHYTNVIPSNQYDINKLWGLSEGLSNSTNSCRIGWSYNNGTYASTGPNSLRLYAYSYANKIRYSQEICIVPINTDLNCSIKVTTTGTYICSVSYFNGSAIVSFSTPIKRTPTTSVASGYQQYPYFGGDEVAPQPIYIKIKPI
jgi:hypothetical protein